MASAHQWLARSRFSACVAPTRSSTDCAAANQRSTGAVAAGGSLAKLVGVGIATGRGGGRLALGPGLARVEVVEDRLGGGGADARHAQHHHIQQCIERARRRPPST